MIQNIKVFTTVIIYCCLHIISQAQYTAYAAFKLQTNKILSISGFIRVTPNFSVTPDIKDNIEKKNYGVLM